MRHEDTGLQRKAWFVSTIAYTSSVSEARRILIVEDSSAMRALIVAVLSEAFEAEGEGAVETEFEEAATGLSAIPLLSRGTFDLIFVDVNIPGLSGLEVVSFIRNKSQSREAPIVLMSTPQNLQDRRRGMALGANTFLGKPFTPEELIDAATSYLEGASG